MKYKIVVPSYNRQHLITQSVIPEMDSGKIFVVVFDREVESYRNILDSCGAKMTNVVGIPGDILGIRAKMEWIVTNLFEEDDDFIFRMDDDILKFFWAMGAKEENLTGSQIYATIESTYEMAKAFGAKVFGIQHLNNIRHARRGKPIIFHRTVGGCYGMMDRTRNYTGDIELGEDKDYSLMSLFLDGITITNGMVCFKTLGSMGMTEGGCASFRTTGLIKESNNKLISKYGQFATKFYQRTKGYVMEQV